MRYFKLCSFAFADTSEGKSIDAMKEEVVQAHGNVAIVSTLVWAIAFEVSNGLCQVVRRGEGVCRKQEVASTDGGFFFHVRALVALASCSRQHAFAV